LIHQHSEHITWHKGRKHPYACQREDGCGLHRASHHNTCPPSFLATSVQGQSWWISAHSTESLLCLAFQGRRNVCEQVVLARQSNFLRKLLSLKCIWKN
jgi:hypothetical protein